MPWQLSAALSSELLWQLVWGRGGSGGGGGGGAGLEKGSSALCWDTQAPLRVKANARWKCLCHSTFLGVADAAEGKVGGSVWPFREQQEKHLSGEGSRLFIQELAGQGMRRQSRLKYLQDGGQVVVMKR